MHREGQHTQDLVWLVAIWLVTLLPSPDPELELFKHGIDSFHRSLNLGQVKHVTSTYACKTWMLRKKDKNKLMAFEFEMRCY